MAIDNVDAALDRLADLGMGALMRDVVEPVCAAMIARATKDLASRGGAKSFFAGYWSVARAMGLAFEEPDIAIRCAAMFFAAAPAACSSWAKIEIVDGRERLGLLDLKELVEAASKARDKNHGAYSRELIDAMVGRQSESAQRAMSAALALEPPRVPKAFDALAKDLEGSFIWPKDATLDDMIERLAAESADRDGLGSDMWTAALDQIEGVAMERRSHAVSCAFALKLAARAAREPKAMGLGAAQWEEWLDRLMDWSDSARQQEQEHKSGLSKGLSEMDAKMLSSFGMVLGSARERFACELALGALERAAEPGSEQASVDLLGMLHVMFWGRGAELSRRSQEKFRAMAGALCNRLSRDGAAACLPLEGAKKLYADMSTFKPTFPESWSAAMDPDTMAWLAEQSEARISGGQWRQLAAFGRLGAIGGQRKERWAQVIASAPWLLAEGEESLSDAVSAKDLARALGPSDSMGKAIVLALDKAGVPDGDALGRLQDLLGCLSDLGASDEGCGLAGDAMSQALAVLERASLDGAVMERVAATEQAPKARPRL
jgi:hypothetical protein